MQVIQFGVLGLGLGALYVLASQGLILVYRGSGVLNFAHGAIGMLGAFIYWDVSVNNGLPFWVGFLLGVGIAALIGALVQILLMRPLRNASPLARIVVTLGLLVVVEWTAILEFGAQVQFIPDFLSSAVLHVGSIYVPVDRLILVGIALAVSAVLWWCYRRTRFGLATMAVAENPSAAAALGWSPDRIAAINWSLGSALAAAAAILVSPIVQLSVTTMTSLVLAAMAAALLAGFTSFPIAAAAGLGLGIAQTEVSRFVPVQGLDSSVPFVVIVLVLLVRGKSIPVRGTGAPHWPWVGTGRLRPGLTAVGIVIAVAVIALTGPGWSDAIQITFAVALVLLSITVVTGYTGQLSLAQYSLAGFGAWIAGRFVVWTGAPFIVALLVAMIATIIIAVLVGIPAVRTRGISLAVVTLGVATAMELMIFDSGPLTGGSGGTNIGTVSLFGLNISSITHPQRWAFVALAALVLLTVMVGNLRRGPMGRKMLAVRTNERAASALGINVAQTKLYAFGLSGAIAAVGGVLIAFSDPNITYTQFSSLTSITLVGFSHLGGVGYLLGPLMGAQLAPGAIGTQIGNVVLPGIVQYIQLIGGASVVLLVLQNQDGMAHETVKQARWVAARAYERLHIPILKQPEIEIALSDVTTARPARVIPRALEVEGLTVRFGGVTALSDVSLTVNPGEVVGLIGPNGAGKTTLIDAVTGFITPASGSIALADHDLLKLSASGRAAAGLSRSFQSLELFEDLTAAENLYAACDSTSWTHGLTDLVRPKAPRLPAELTAAVMDFGLEHSLAKFAQDLPYGERRLLAIVRAIALHPSVLLLDEPASGLSDAESHNLARLVRRLAADWGMAVLLVEHHVEMVMAACDRIVVLEFGQRIAAGTPEEIRADPAVISAYLGGDETKPVATAPASTPAPA